VTVELASAGHRALASDIECGERVELARVRPARDHPVLLLHRGVRGGRLHAAEFDRRPLVLIEIGQDRRGLDRLSREAQRRRRAHHSGRFSGWPAILGYEPARNTVIGPCTLDIVLNHGNAGGLSVSNRLVQFVDRRFFETKRLCICHEHKLASN